MVYSLSPVGLLHASRVNSTASRPFLSTRIRAQFTSVIDHLGIAVRIASFAQG